MVLMSFISTCIDAVRPDLLAVTVCGVYTEYPEGVAVYADKTVTTRPWLLAYPEDLIRLLCFTFSS